MQQSTQKYLTRVERRVLDFIINFYELYHYAPTIREISSGCYTSISYAWEIVHRLRDMGYIDFKEKRMRTIVLK